MYLARVERPKFAEANADFVELASRASLAVKRSKLAGVDPFSLRPNTLDEEPLDGYTDGYPGHFAWREWLSER